jgi:hypothetical protein
VSEEIIDDEDWIEIERQASPSAPLSEVSVFRPDLHTGKFENFKSRGGTERLCIGAVTAWPNEERAATEAAWSEDSGCMKLRLPENFAIAAPAPCPPSVPPSAHVTRLPAAPQRSNITASAMGDPPPGRSALDQRREKTS